MSSLSREILKIVWSSNRRTQNIVVVSQVGEGNPGCRLFRFPSASPMASRKDLPVNLDSDLEPASMRRAPVVEEPVAWRYLERSLNTMLELGFWIERGIRAEQRKEMLLEERHGGVDAPIEKEGGDDRFKGCRKQCRSQVPLWGLAPSQAEEARESQLRACLGQGGPVNHAGAESSQGTGRDIGIPFIEVERHEKGENGVAEKLQASKSVSLVPSRGMGECCPKEGTAAKAMSQCSFSLPVPRIRVSLFSLPPHSVYSRLRRSCRLATGRKCHGRQPLA